MVKAYLRYEAAATFGVVASTAANVVFDASGKLVVSPALESVLVWNVKQGAAVSPSHKMYHIGSSEFVLVVISRNAD
jgi:U3 small nucleolar RNA-associated protein 12